MTPVALVTPTVAPHVFDGEIDGETVLFNSRDRRLHVLNPSAASVWSRLAQPTTVATLTADIAAAFDVTAASIRVDVERTLDRFVADGLVGTFDPERAPSSFDGPRPRTAVAIVAAALGETISLHVSDAAAAAAVVRIAAPLEATSMAGSSWISLEADGGAWTVTSSIGTVARTGGRLSGVLRLISEINSIAVDARPNDLVFHAGAVTRNGRSVVLPGSSNRGKSTLTTALVRAGFGYLTDEAAAVSPDLMVRPYAKSIALDPGSFGLFNDLAPDPVGPLESRMARREWHLDPRSIGSVSDAAPVSVIVCPSWRAGATTRLTPVAGAEALHTLLGDAFDFRVGGRSVFDVLVDVVAQVPVYRLGYGDLTEAVEVIGEVLDAR